VAIPKILGAQRDFSGGELDEAMKRADENPMMKIGARQLSNWRILSGGAASNRPGRSALFNEGPGTRVEEVLMSPGNMFYLAFGSNYLRVYNAFGAQVFNSTVKGDGATAIPWSSATVKNIVFLIAAGSALAIYITYADGAPNNVPQILTWDGVSQTSTWTLSTYAEAITANGQKRTAFYRISPQNVTMLPSATIGNINVTFSSALLYSGMVGTRMRYCNRQILIRAVTAADFATPIAGPSQYGTATVIESLPPAVELTLTGTVGGFSLGDEIIGGTSGGTGIITASPQSQNVQFTVATPPNYFLLGDAVSGGTSGATGTVGAILYQYGIYGGNILGIGINLSTSTLFQVGEDVGGVHGAGISAAVSGGALTAQIVPNANDSSSGFAVGELVVGPAGSGTISTQTVTTPQAVSIWDDEVMNLYRGYPSSAFYDQGRLGFCNFPAVPSGIGWAAIGLPTDLYVAALPDNAIFEIAPGKSQVFFVLPGMESAEFVFCDNAIYYIPISVTNPLVPGSVSFNLLSQQGCMPNVKPQPCEQTILYMKTGGTQVGAVQAPGAYYRPYIVDSVSEFHSHLFTASPPIAIAVPSSSTQFEELYAYILLANGTLVVGKYGIRNGLLETGEEGKPKIGWLPWTNAGSVFWIAALSNQVTFSSSYVLNGIASGVIEKLDNSQYLDCALSVNSLPAAFTPPGGKGPLYVFPGPNSSVTLIDQGTRMMGTYQVDANGNIVPQGQGGENLASPQLVAGQPWAATLEPFVPDAQPGQSLHQRMFKRRVSRMATYVSNSTGFLLARLFSGPITPVSPALGTIMNTYRVTAWNQGDIVTNPPPLREQAYRWRPLGRAYDPRVCVIKDTPGPLLIHEIGIEASI
jgi:hypothetical protein